LTTPSLVYAPGYDITLLGLERLHPFDGRKFSRAWRLLRERLGAQLDALHHEPAAPITHADLLAVHTPAYLASLRSPAVVARALEVRALGWLPASFVESRLLRPMQLATAGTVLAAQRALHSGGMAFNLGGGFHHAFADHGEGFCLYADVALALALARRSGALAPSDAVAVIDLDAHRGNGVWSLCGADPAVRVLDLYNAQAYPGLFEGDPDRFEFQVPLKAMTGGADYLAILREMLPRFLAAGDTPRLAVYNAGTDVVAGDPLGRLNLSEDEVAERDRLVVRTLAERGIPTLIVTSGGYTRASHRLVAQLAIELVEAALRPAVPA
jgi:histone deacetylase 11